MNMNRTYQSTVLLGAITPLRHAFSVVLASILLCLVGQSVSADLLVATGDDGHGQLGNGTTTSTNVMSAVSGTGDVTAEGAGASSAFAVQNGALYAWGYNADGELGNGTTNESHLPLPVSGLSSGVTAVTAGLRHALALKDGIVYAWGYNGPGELGNGTFDYAPHTTPAPVIGLSGVTAIAAGDYHSLALQDGAVYGWGWNDVGELGQNGDSSSQCLPVLVTGMNEGVTAIAAGSYFSMAIKNGAVWGWGANDYGQLGNGASTYAQSSPVQVTGLNSGVTAIAAGYQHALAVSNGVVYAWGRNYYGELGNGAWSSRYVPVLVGGLPGNIVAVAAGYGSSYALSSDGRLWAWGNGGAGQLGKGDDAWYNTPQELLAPAGYRFASIDSDASGNYAMARQTPVPVILSLSWSNGAPCLSLTGAIRGRYALEWVSALPPNNNWQRLATNQLTSNPWTVTDTSAAGNATRFYRAVLLP
jgi:alpha-tubulin suppressor-like RCC1 family protein